MVETSSRPCLALDDDDDAIQERAMTLATATLRLVEGPVVMRSIAEIEDLKISFQLEKENEEGPK